jgi:hypothetical protein
VNESEYDTRAAREPADLKVASLLMWVATGANVMRTIRADADVFECVLRLCDAGAAALRRGARIGELVTAWTSLRHERQREVEDEPTMRTRRVTPPPLPSVRRDE